MSQGEPVIKDPPDTKDAQLLQFFVQSLEGVAFIWYASLLKNSIISWQAMDDQMLALFCNIRKNVRVLKPIDTK